MLVAKTPWLLRSSARSARAALAASVLALIAAWWGGCTDARALAFPISVRVESDPGVPLTGVAVLLGERALGKTDARGVLALSLNGAPGESVALRVSCPSGHRPAEEALHVRLRPLLGASQKPEYLASCRPELRTLVIAVRAQNGVGIPLKHLGSELARTDAQGVAHASLKLSPGETVSLVLDTHGPEHKALRPQNPELKLTVPEHDDVVLFDQTFHVDAPKKPKPPPPRPLGPVRL